MVKIYSLCIFAISICASLFLVALERQLGIGWEYQPDAATDVNTYKNIISIIIDSNGRDLLTQFYFVFSLLFLALGQLFSKFSVFKVFKTPIFVLCPLILA